MISGLQITMRADELSQRMTERIRIHEATVAALDARIRERQNDDPDTAISVDDNFETLRDLRTERDQWRDRILQLTLLRDSLVAGGVYALTRSDLAFAGLTSPASGDVSAGTEIRFLDDRTAIDGLKLRISGEEMRTLLEQRIRDHQRRAERWRYEERRTPEQQTEDEPLLPEQMCASEAERHEWRAGVLRFIRDHIDPAETYRLGEADLEFGELLPEKPGCVEQAEYEERTSVGFNLERLTKRVGELVSSQYALAAEHADRE